MVPPSGKTTVKIGILLNSNFFLIYQEYNPYIPIPVGEEMPSYIFYRHHTFARAALTHVFFSETRKIGFLTI